MCFSFCNIRYVPCRVGELFSSFFFKDLRRLTLDALVPLVLDCL